jgi:hypothetical protein
VSKPQGSSDNLIWDGSQSPDQQPQNQVNIPAPANPPAGGGIRGFFQGLFAVIGGIVAGLMMLVKLSNWLSNNSSHSPSTRRYQCISGHIEHATHWTGPRKCSICGKSMFWRT